MIEYVTLCCSMLRAENYTAYMAFSNDPLSPAWVVFELNGTFVHLNAYPSWGTKLTSYEAGIFIDENGVYPAGVVSQDAPPFPKPSKTPAPTPTSTPEENTQPNPTSTPTSIIPEFSPVAVVLALTLASMSMVTYYRKKHAWAR